MSGADTAPILFDEALRVQRRERAARVGVSASWLEAMVAEDIGERLAVITRRFSRGVVLGAGAGAVGDALLATGVAAVVEIEPAPTSAAALRARRADDPRVRVALGDPLLLDPAASDLAPADADLVVSVLTLHAANDPVGALVRARLLLAPDGLFLGAVVGGETLTELRRALAEAEIDATGGLRPRVAPMAELHDWGGLMQRAGFALPVADADRLRVGYPSALALMRELRALGETSTLAGRPRGFSRRAVLLGAAARYPTRPDGRIDATLERITLSGWAPAPTQQQPLRPGEGRTSLAQALRAAQQ